MGAGYSGTKKYPGPSGKRRNTATQPVGHARKDASSARRRSARRVLLSALAPPVPAEAGEHAAQNRARPRFAVLGLDERL